MADKMILVVDDDELVRILMTQYVQHGGYQVVTAADGAAGVELYGAEHPDLVVLDIAMPGMSGLETAEAIRRVQNDRSWPHTPIILLTAYARSFFIPVGHDHRIDSLIHKPIERDEFLQHIGRFFTPDRPG